MTACTCNFNIDYNMLSQISTFGAANSHALHGPCILPLPVLRPMPHAVYKVRSLPQWWEENDSSSTLAEDNNKQRGSWREKKRRSISPRPPPSSAEIPLARIGPGETSNFFSSHTWSSVGATPELIAALESLGVSRPSHIQAAAFRAFSTAAPHLVLADHAGSGKTLAYLTPLIQLIKGEEQALGGPATVPRCPRVIVVVPTAELCAQVLRVCRAVSQGGLRFKSAAFTGGHAIRTQRETLEAGVDIAVGTPRRLAELLSSGALSLDRCSAVVCDEVDVLLGGASEFAEQVSPLRAAAPLNTRFVLVTATMPAETFAALEPQFPGIVAALGPGLHRTAPGITQQIVDCSGGDEVNEESGRQRKSAALFAALQERRAPRSIVFCNKVETCRGVENFLNRTLAKQDPHVKVLPYHSAIRDDQRVQNLRQFLSPPRRPRNHQGGGRRRGDDEDYDGGETEQERLILVSTDRASRGVDSAFVDHVILFDFPRDPSEYVRRVGRTARGAGGRGLVTVLVLGRQVKLAKEVVNRDEKGLPVHALPKAMPASAATTETPDAARFAADLRQAAASSSDSS